MESRKNYININDWKCLEKDFNFNKFKGKECIVGIAKTNVTGLVSIGFEFVEDNGEYYVLSHSFLPEEAYKKEIKKNQLSWDLWKDENWLIVTSGVCVPNNVIKTYIRKAEKTYELIIKEICYDPWNSNNLSCEFIKDGYKVSEVRQNSSSIGSVCKDFRKQVQLKNLNHNNNPLLNLAINNAIIKENTKGDFVIDVSKSPYNTSPINSILNAHYRIIKLK